MGEDCEESAAPRGAPAEGGIIPIRNDRRRRRDIDLGRDVAAALHRAGIGDVDTSSLARALYSTDASLYRIPPHAVVRPRTIDELAATIDVCRELETPITARGAGTSIAGNAIGPGIVVDTSRYLDRIIEIDPGARTATVEPGIVQARLQAAVARHGLRFGPDPSTHNRATIGGMIGNNACGARALAYGRTSDNVVALDVVTGSGQRLALRSGQTTPQLESLRDIANSDLATIRTEFARFGRQNSGYSLEHLLPERGFDVAKFLVGTEGTLAVILRATMRLVVDPPVRVLVILGFPGMAEAADAVTAVLPHRPTACEGLDSRMVDALRARPASVVPPLPGGSGWLFVELVGDTESETTASAEKLIGDVDAVDSAIVTDAAHRTALWRIREDGAGLAARTPDGRPAHAGWEDAAVPPERLGSYLREFDRLLTDYHLTGLPYGHFGDGCVHVRLDFPLDRPDGPRQFAGFLADAAALVTRHGGSLSGEHGDGRARGALLPTMYSQQAIEMFAAVKHVFDPHNLLNPGVVVDPAPVARDLRLATVEPVRHRLALAHRHDGGDFAAAVHRCTGIGKCRADLTGAGGVMCPSFIATRNEKDTTRGRSRVLQELVNADGLVTGWSAPEVHAALDLCLACKGCSRDCPTGVDMASYKAEVLYQSYRRRVRPRTHYSLGWLPVWARLAATKPGLANAAMGRPAVARVARWAAGIDQRRPLPEFAQQPFADWFRRRNTTETSRPPVLLFADTFTNYFSPEVGKAAVDVLEDAGYRVEIPRQNLCCGLTWVSTGQLGIARRVMARTIKALLPYAAAGIPIVGLEPSCTAALRAESRELLRDDPASQQVADATRTLAELLTTSPGWQPPPMAGTTVVAQPHCHHHAVLGWETDAKLLAKAGAQVTRLGGCCGLAGNWGVERGHHEASVAIAEHQLLPAVEAAASDTVVLADGFSCRTQLQSLSTRRGIHLAELLARRRNS